MNEADDELRAEYDFDFSTADCGKYFQSYLASCNVVKLDGDVAQRFPTAEAVNAKHEGLRR